MALKRTEISNPRSREKWDSSIDDDELVEAEAQRSAAKLRMGIIRSSLTFLVGTGLGVYLAQNYNVPNIKKLTNTGMLIAKHVEENYRKPKKKDDE